MNVQNHLPLAPRDLLILAVLAEAPLHGYGIIKEVEARSEAGVLLDPANLYRVLRRMRGSGWIREAPQSAAAARPVSDTGGGSTAGDGDTDSRRRTYEITSEGRSLLQAEVVRLERLLRKVRPAMAEGDGR
jgi:DNA-binding PadR family transcriptional regulator